MTLQRQSPKYQQIIGHFSQRIFDGSLKAGARIPSTTDLANRFEVNPETVQLALRKMVERGLVERRRGAGTFVRKGVQGRTCAVVFGEDNFTRIDLSFFNVLLKCLMRRLPAAGWDVKHFITTQRPEADAAFHALEKGVADGSIRAVIEFCSNGMVKKWLKDACPVPSSTSGAKVDFVDMAEKGLEHLLRMGRRRPVVCGCGSEGISLTELRKVVDAVSSRYGVSPGDVRVEGSGQEFVNGYNEVMRLVRKGVPFDSLLVMFDTAFRGALYALLEKGIRIPDDVAVVTHANKGVELFCHVPLTKLEVDPDDFAAGIVDEIEHKIAGERFMCPRIKPKLVIGKSCGE